MNRWGKRDGAGKQLMGYTKSLVAKDAKTFEWTLSEPYGLLIDTLAKTGTSIPFVMREKEAMVDPFQQIQEVVGSGPFAFKRDEWVPGNKTVYIKFKDYVPRKEPASGHAGGKVVKVDRVEFLWLPDPQTAQSAWSRARSTTCRTPSRTSCRSSMGRLGSRSGPTPPWARWGFCS
jgi:peptide/nickel transport system substrate-binding protein